PQQPTRQPAIGRSNDKHGQLVVADLMPERQGAARVAAYGFQHRTKGRSHNATSNKIAKEKEDGYKPVHRPSTTDMDGGKTERNLRRRHPCNSILAAGVLLECRVFEKIKHLAKRQRTHGKV